MREWLRSRHRRLFFRSYFVLAGGLLLVATILDLGFGALQERQAHSADPWAERTFSLLESTLAALPQSQRQTAAAELGHRLGISVQLVDRGDVAGAHPTAAATQTVLDERGRSYYLRSSQSLGAVIRLGPVEVVAESLLTRLLPALFYLSILVIVGLWLRPLFRDLRVLTDASQKFAADYRQPLYTAANTTQLTSLATNLDDMSARISHLIENQKELTAALSHEMRTPLARIRFALAVIGNQTDAPMQQQLRDVNADVQQIDDLIANMLHYARLDHPGLRTEWQDTPLEAWLRHVLAACTQRRAVEVIRSADFERAWMEPRLMELALSNLVVNAQRHASNQVAVTVARSDGNYRILVEDDGDGIPAEQRDAVFNAFTRLDSSRHRDKGGFGLGLAIVARIAALHRGRVSAGHSDRLGGAKLALEWPVPEPGVTPTLPQV